MTQSKRVKNELKKQLKKHFGSDWANKVAEHCDYVPDTIRRYFSSDTSNEHIMSISLDVVAQAREDEDRKLKELRA